MLFHDAVFFICQLVRFVEYVIGNADLTNIVKQSRIVEIVCGIFVHAYFLRYFNRILCHSCRVSLCVGVFGVDRVGYCRHCLFRYSAQLFLPFEKSFVFTGIKKSCYQKYRQRRKNSGGC